MKFLWIFWYYGQHHDDNQIHQILYLKNILSQGIFIRETTYIQYIVVYSYHETQAIIVIVYICMNVLSLFSPIQKRLWKSGPIVDVVRTSIPFPVGCFPPLSLIFFGIAATIQQWPLTTTSSYRYSNACSRYGLCERCFLVSCKTIKISTVVLPIYFFPENLQ